MANNYSNLDAPGLTWNVFPNKDNTDYCITSSRSQQIARLTKKYGEPLNFPTFEEAKAHGDKLIGK